MSGPPSTKPPLSSRFARLVRDSSDTIRTDRPTLSPISIASLMQLETPHAVVNCERMYENIDTIAQYAREHRLNLRPDVKTHKDPEVAKAQLANGAIGVTVATAKEAEAMATVCDDILVAYPTIDPARIDRLLELPRRVTLTIAIDSLEALRRLNERAQRKPSNRTIRVLVEVDVGQRRTGLSDPTQICELAHEIAKGPITEFWGIGAVFTHVRRVPQDPGLPVTAPRQEPDPSIEQMRRISEDLRSYIAALKESGLACPIVSGGSTPSLFLSHFVPELTEIRPGTYIYADRDVASQGILGWENCAYSILATVISTSVPGQAVIDAGSKAMGKEPLAGIDGYGALLDSPEVFVRELTEEYGILDLSRSRDWAPKVGDRVRVIPNHASMSVHLQDQVAYAETGELTLRDVIARSR